MTDRELIHNLKELRKIKPRKDWVVLTKSRILTQEQQSQEEVSIFSLFRYRTALAPVLGVLIVVGLFGFAQKTVPGDFFFSLKEMTETVQVGFSSFDEKPKVSLQLANKRLEELSRIAESNRVENLGPAIEEFQESLSEATRNIAGLDANVTSSDPVILKDLVQETIRLEENKKKVETVLGTKVGDTKELGSAIVALEKRMAAYLIGDLETRTLSDKAQGLLDEAKVDYQEGNYQEALYKLWQIHND